ncbi:MAG: hypothetical protein HPY71_14680 [Firmicutes bacterium]|nr:hypothetical protein [Bacillota bacterium]
MKKRVMLYLNDDDFRRLSSLAKKAGTSMNALVVSLLWQADMPKRKAGEALEYVCRRCGRKILADVADVMPPDECPYPACGGVLAPTGRGLTLIVGRIE